ncbi:MAG: hypothetical protein DMF63_17425 [Acidobacteria bacterium]|nr:MAG: hypothetical protein DMF63_17425 [Acidobacteriota bacterium]
MNGDPNVVGLACEAGGLRFLITRRNHLNPYTDDTPREIFDSNRKLFKGIFGKPDEFSESDDCQTDHPCHIYDISVKDMRVRSQIVVTRDATIEAMVGTVPRESGGVSKESLASFDETFNEFIGALEVSK